LLVSGPVGGVLSAIFFGRLTGRENLISMDMGGTSFDVSLIEGGRANQTTEFEIEWGLPVYTPMVDVKTIGAGGGSIAWIDKGGLLRTGPQSAGAYPGPVCYGRGGTEATVTDANLALGRINPEYFLGGELTLDLGASLAALERLGAQLSMGVEETASSIVELVDFNMVDAIRLVSIDRGLDPRDFSLIAFGGAGSLHAGALAEIIGISDVLVPIHQGVFSAFGLMTADMRVDESVTANFRSDLLDLERLNAVLARLRSQALARLKDEGYRGEVVLEPKIEMRYLGQNHSIEIAVPVVDRAVAEPELDEIYERFQAEHRRLYGYEIPDEIIELVNVTVTALGATEKPQIAKLARGGALRPKGEREVYFRSAGGWLPTVIYERSSLPVGAHFEGPAVIEEEMSTTLIHPGQTVDVDEYATLVLHTSTGRLT
jgi:N-methylhydantoinase A